MTLPSSKQLQEDETFVPILVLAGVRENLEESPRRHTKKQAKWGNKAGAQKMSHIQTMIRGRDKLISKVHKKGNSLSKVA
jgi:hypothetical protein